MEKAKNAVRTIRNGRVKLFGHWYVPQNGGTLRAYLGELDGQRSSFHVYDYYPEIGRPRLACFDGTVAYLAKENTIFDSSSPGFDPTIGYDPYRLKEIGDDINVIDGYINWQFWQEVPDEAH